MLATSDQDCSAAKVAEIWVALNTLKPDVSVGMVLGAVPRKANVTVVA
jgi:hypothetical protein